MTKATTHTQLGQQRVLRWLKLGDLKIAPAAQREFRPHHADKILNEFDLDKLGTPTVNERLGVLHVVDGQHSIDALRRWLGPGWQEQQLQCWLYKDLTEEQEADLFLSLNNNLMVAVFDKFRVAVTADRPVETDIDRIVRAQGLVITKDRARTPGAVRAVGTLRKIYERSDANCLGRTLRIIRDSFGDAGFEASVIDGIGHLTQRFNGEVPEEEAIAALRKVNAGVKGLLGQARVTREKMGSTIGLAVAATALDAVNRQRAASRRLPNWFKS